MTSPPRRDPGTIGALVVLGQAVAVFALGLWAVLEAVTGNVDDRVAAGLIAAFALLTGLALAFVARGLFFARRWARAPVVVWELIMLPVGLSLAHAIAAAGAVVMASAAAALLALYAGRPAAD